MDDQRNNNQAFAENEDDAAANQGEQRSEDPQPETPSGFEVRDQSTANWLVRKIVETRLYRRRIREWAEIETRRAEREEQFFLQRYGVQLEAWARREIGDGTRKCVKLPAGTVGFRTEQCRLEIKDESRLISWCRRSLPSAIRIDTHVLKSIVNEHVVQTGECPDGTDLAGGGQRFYVK